MKSHKARRLMFFLCLLALVLMVGCSRSTGGNADQQAAGGEEPPAEEQQEAGEEAEPSKPPLEGVRLTISFSPPTLGNIVGYKAMEIMEHWGAEVESVEIVSTGTALQAIVAGQNQLGEGSVSQGYASIHAGADLVMVGGHDSGNDWVLVTRKDIASLDQLKGRLYALGSTRGEDPTLRNLAFSLTDLDPAAEPTAVIGGNSDRARALLAGQADAANLHLPWYNFLIAQTDDVHILLNFAEQFPAFLSDFYWAERGWAEQNRNVLVAWEMANLLAARWIFDHPDAALAYAAEKIPEFNVEEESKTLEFFIENQMWKPDGAMDPDIIQESYDILRENVGFDGPPLDVNDFARPEYDQEALAKIGPYQPGTMPENVPADLPESIHP